jgi:hypothetical protein
VHARTEYTPEHTGTLPSRRRADPPGKIEPLLRDVQCRWAAARDGPSQVARRPCRRASQTRVRAKPEAFFFKFKNLKSTPNASKVQKYCKKYCECQII